MWQALREELYPALEIVTVGLDTLGVDGCKAFIDAAAPKHPALIDTHHVLARQFGVINIPSSIWIDESGTIVRPAETAPAPPPKVSSEASETADQQAAALPSDLPPRLAAMMSEAAKIRSSADEYHEALRDWVTHGKDSRYALSPADVVERSRPRSGNVSLGHAHFELASQLEIDGHHDAAVAHFRDAHRLVPDSWTFRRQAWSLESGLEGPLARFWQGPSDDNPHAWPYQGDWLTDIQREGAANYNDPWKP